MTYRRPRDQATQSAFDAGRVLGRSETWHELSAQIMPLLTAADIPAADITELLRMPVQPDVIPPRPPDIDTVCEQATERPARTVTMVDGRRVFVALQPGDHNPLDLWAEVVTTVRRAG